MTECRGLGSRQFQVDCPRKLSVLFKQTKTPCETSLPTNKSQLQLLNCAMNAYFGVHVVPVLFRAFGQIIFNFWWPFLYCQKCFQQPVK